MTRTKSLKSIAAAALVLTLPLTPATANEHWTAEELRIAKIIEDVGGSERINLSGKLRMLSQRIPSAACHLNSDVAPTAAKDLLNGATAEFQKIVDGLEFGDPDLGVIGEENRRKTLIAIQNLRDNWKTVFERVIHLNDVGHDDDDVRHLAEHNMPLLGTAKLLVTEITGQYSDPTSLLQVDSLRIDIAGRQRMLTQKMSKEACFALNDINTEANIKAMKGTIQMFDLSLHALRDGLPAAGIKPTTNPDIKSKLDVVFEDWAAVKPDLEALAEGKTWDAATWEHVFIGLNKTMKDMNTVVGMYAQASKLNI